jgi:hypothetical protein
MHNDEGYDTTRFQEDRDENLRKRDSLYLYQV